MTLVAAWKTQSCRNHSSSIGIKIMTDSMLSGTGYAITKEWEKMYGVEPKISTPIFARDEDWTICFHSYEKTTLPSIGLFFAGSNLPFDYIKTFCSSFFQNLGLKATHDESGKFIKTKIVCDKCADKFGVADSVFENLYAPTPELDLEWVAKSIQNRLQDFYDKDPYAIRTGPGFRNVHFKIELGIAGFCAKSRQFRIFELKSVDPFEETQDPNATTKVRLREVKDDEVILFGPDPITDKIRNEIFDIKATNPADRCNLIRKIVLDEIECRDNEKLGIGGRIKYGSVDKERGFSSSINSWVPSRDFSPASIFGNK